MTSRARRNRYAPVPFSPALSVATAVTLAYIWLPLVDVLGALFRALSGRVDTVALSFSAVALLARWGLVRAALAVRSPFSAVGLLGAGLPGLSLLFAMLHWANPSATVNSLAPRLLAIGTPVVLGYVLILVWLAWPHLRARSHEGTDWALALAAFWVAIPATMQIVVMTRAQNRVVLALYASIVVVLPLIIAFAVVVRIVLRRRWLQHVREGLCLPWRIVERDAPDNLDKLPSLTKSKDGSKSAVLVRVRELLHPFRDEVTLEPVGFVARGLETRPGALPEARVPCAGGAESSVSGTAARGPGAY